ncbi:dirigent protein [Actinophytocola gossypii]|uniref:Dirigent protein n=1 Tax=Actinophytocola gossypii TaxID=2812003 RepID=A0ABT2J2Q9_9PSEU|nr:dirigent protein [Actinophytocola gossypii]MCT2581785.1 dirigent protein [Actinophytocola gossypii]
MSTNKTRTRTASIAVAAVAIATATLGGCAAARGESRGTAGERVEILELKVENTHYQAVDLAPPGVSLGDLDVFAGTARKDGREVGRGGGSCQTIHVEGDDVSMQCVLTMELERGSVTMQSVWTRGENPLDMAITGGTGDYRTARGIVRFWDIATPNERVRAEIIR